MGESDDTRNQSAYIQAAHPWGEAVLAPLYDAFPFSDDLPLYVELAEAATREGGQVLEVACGSGRVLVALARAGCRITGVDVSPHMLALAREKLMAAGPDVAARARLVQADMRSFELGEQFDMAFIAVKSFSYLGEPRRPTARPRQHRDPPASRRAFRFGPDESVPFLAAPTTREPQAGPCPVRAREWSDCCTHRGRRQYRPGRASEGNSLGLRGGGQRRLDTQVLCGVALPLHLSLRGRALARARRIPNRGAIRGLPARAFHLRLGHDALHSAPPRVNPSPGLLVAGGTLKYRLAYAPKEERRRLLPGGPHHGPPAGCFSELPA